MSVDENSSIRVVNFDRAITSLESYPSLEHVPRAVFRSLNGVIAKSDMSLEDACSFIEIKIGINRKDIMEKLRAFPARRKPSSERTA